MGCTVRIRKRVGPLDESPEMRWPARRGAHEARKGAAQPGGYRIHDGIDGRPEAPAPTRITVTAARRLARRSSSSRHSRSSNRSASSSSKRITATNHRSPTPLLLHKKSPAKSVARLLPRERWSNVGGALPLRRTRTWPFCMAKRQR